MKRRDFGRSVLTGSALGIAGCKDVPETPSPVSEAKKSYGALYYEKAREIWEREATSELPLIIEAADKAAKSLKNGRKLYSHSIFGHMLDAEFRADRAGNPNYLPNWSRETAGEEYEAVGEGDFLFFDYALPRVKAARDRGAYTVGVRVPYLPNETIPAGVLYPKYRLYGNIETEQCSSLILTSGVPFTDGVLFVPEIPAVRACPISVQGAGMFYWMLTAEIAVRDKDGSLDKGAGALEYINCIMERGALIRGDLEHINDAAKAMTGCVANGGSYWNYSYGCEFAVENYIRASGIAMSQLIKPDEMKEKVKRGDFAIVAGEFSDVKENVEMARALKDRRATVISIGPAQSDGSLGDDLSKTADWHIETYSPEREGVVSIHGFERKICPATGNLFALALWMLNSQFIERMIEADMIPGLDMGVHLMGGRGYNSAVRNVVAERGY